MKFSTFATNRTISRKEATIAFRINKKRQDKIRCFILSGAYS